MSYEIRFSALAATRLHAPATNQGRIRHGVRRLAGRARLNAPRLRARTAAGALLEGGPLCDPVTISRLPARDGGFFLVRAGYELVACDVFPEARVVLVLSIASRNELASKLGLSYSLVQTVFSSR